MEIKKALKQSPLQIYIVEDIDLTQYSKTDTETKMKYPSVKPIQMDSMKFNNFINKRQK